MLLHMRNTDALMWTEKNHRSNVAAALRCERCSDVSASPGLRSRGSNVARAFWVNRAGNLASLPANLKTGRAGFESKRTRRPPVRTGGRSPVKCSSGVQAPRIQSLKSDSIHLGPVKRHRFQLARRWVRKPMSPRHGGKRWGGHTGGEKQRVRNGL